MKIVMGIEYRGTHYSGWQRQKHSPSVQQHVEESLSRVANESISVQCAGRTDRGVHALHQIIHFETAARRRMHSWVLGGNVHLPRDISMLWAKPVGDDFNARFSASSRIYLYVILNRTSRPGLLHHKVTWHCRPIDVQRMAQAAVCLEGEHDFTSYRAIGCQANSPVRSIHHISVRRQGDFIFLRVEANAFLHHMVRNIAGVLMDIGTGKAGINWARQVLEARDRTLGGATAPADGLYLFDVRYPQQYNIPVFDELNCPFGQ